MESEKDQLHNEDSPYYIKARQMVRNEVLWKFIDLLKSGRLSPGDKLPPERELALMMGISRPTLREALGALNLLGITESRQGSGTYLVKSLDKLPLAPYVFQLLLNNGSLQEVMEIREIIEPHVTALAAARANFEDIQDIQQKFKAFENEVVQSNWDMQLEARAGVEFHEALARAAKNETLAVILKSLSNFINSVGQLLVSHHPGASLDDYRAITVAIQERDPIKARNLMAMHLASVKQRLNTAIEDFQDQNSLKDT